MRLRTFARTPAFTLLALALAVLPAAVYGATPVSIGAGLAAFVGAAALGSGTTTLRLHLADLFKVSFRPGFALQGGHVAGSGGLELKNFNPADVPAEPQAAMKFLTGKLGELGNVFEQFKKANDEAIKQGVKGAVDPILKEQTDKLNTAVGLLSETKERVDQVEVALKRTVQATGIDPRDESAAAINAKALQLKRAVAVKNGDSKQAYGLTVGAEDVKFYNEYRSALDKFVRFGEKSMSADELKTLYVGSQQDGGYLATPDLTGRMVQKIFETSPIRTAASVQAISRPSLVGIFDLAETGADWEGELATSASTTTPTIQRWEIPAHIMRARPRASQEFLEDAEINVDTWLGAKIGDKFARTENAAFVNGTGVGKPRGFLTYPVGSAEILPGAGTPTMQYVYTGASGGFASAPAGGDFLLDMIGAMKAGYLARARWAANRLSIAGLRKLKDSYGAYLWAPGLTAGQPQTLLGYPLMNFEDMPSVTTASALFIALADWEQTYQIVDRVGVSIQRDPYTQKPLVEFYARRRVGGDVLNFESIKLGRSSTS